MPDLPPSPVSLRPWNLALRFMLELWALLAMGLASRDLLHGWLRSVAMLAVPLAAAAAWGTFTVRGDPSRGKTGPVPVSGPVRLAVEAAFFGLACALLLLARHIAAALGLGALIALHYAAAHARTRWLVAQRSRRRQT